MSTLNYVVGIDGSEWSERAAVRAVNLAKATNAEVKLVYVLDYSTLRPLTVEAIVPPTLNQEEAERDANQQTLEPLINRFADSGVVITSECIWGEPVATLHEQVKELNANMLFLGRRGRSALVDLLLGSVANKLAHYTGVPIVLVP